MVIQFLFSSIRSLQVNVFFFFICFEILSTGLGDPIQIITNNSGIYFNYIGSAFHHINDVNLNVHIDTQPIGKCIKELEQLNKRIVQLVSYSSKNFTYNLPQFEENIRKIKTNFEMVPFLAGRKRFRRDLTAKAALADLINNRRKLVNTTATAIETTLHKLDINFERLDEALRKFDDSDHQTQILSIAIQFLQLQQQVELQITELQNAVLFARRNVIHPSVMTPSRLSEFMSSGSWPSVIRFPPDDSESMARYLDICAISTHFEGHQLVFTISIPQILATRYDVYSLLEFPKATQDNKFTFIKPTDNFLLINITSSKYAYLHSLDSCTAVNNTLWICPSLLIQTNLDYNCETSILAERPPRCTIQQFNGIPDIWYPLDDNRWAFVQPKDSQINITFLNGTSSTFQLPTNGILKLDGLADTENRFFFHSSVVDRQIISVPHLVSNATFSGLPYNFSLPIFEKFDFSTFEAVINQSHQELKTLQQLFNAIADHEPSDSANLQAALDQLEQLRAQQHDQLQQLGTLRPQIDAIDHRRSSEKAFQTTVNLILAAAISILAIFVCVFGYLLYRRIRKISSSKAVPFALGVRNIDTCKTQ